jgi:heme-degrading monooxygenase HmoA
MIARLWSAQATPVQAPAYAEHLRRQVVPALQQLDGYAGALLLERALPAAVEILVLTFWRSAEAIQGFAGDDPGRAVVAAEAAALLTQFDRQVRHYEVVVDHVPSAGRGPSSATSC